MARYNYRVRAVCWRYYRHQNAVILRNQLPVAAMLLGMPFHRFKQSLRISTLERRVLPFSLWVSNGRNLPTVPHCNAGENPDLNLQVINIHFLWLLYSGVSRRRNFQRGHIR